MAIDRQIPPRQTIMLRQHFFQQLFGLQQLCLIVRRCSLPNAVCFFDCQQLPKNCFAMHPALGLSQRRVMMPHQIQQLLFHLRRQTQMLHRPLCHDIRLRRMAVKMSDALCIHSKCIRLSTVVKQHGQPQ